MGVREKKQFNARLNIERDVVILIGTTTKCYLVLLARAYNTSFIAYIQG